MSAKQDRTAARTPADLERKYDWETSFAEIMGVATDARKIAETARSLAGNTAAKLTPEEVFNLLTENGTLQGLYRGDDGELYVNANYIKSGVISGDRIDGTTLNIKQGAIIGGWSIGSNTIHAVNNGLYTTIKKDGSVALAFGSPSPTSTTGANVQFWHDGKVYLGYKGNDTYNFKVDASGNVTLKGEITATAGGKIGGWDIADSTLYGESGMNGDLSISPTGVTGKFMHPDGYEMTATVSWYRIMSAAMAWEG